MQTSLLLDIRPAFDTVRHAHVLQGLLNLGIKGRMLRWMNRFLKGRKIFISTSDGKIQEHIMPQGVSQGCVLTSTLFIVQSCPKYRLYSPFLNFTIYADDNCIFASGSFIDILLAQLQGLDVIERG